MKKVRTTEGQQSQASNRFCPICGSPMVKVSENPDVLICPKCGFKIVLEPGKK
jgi:hypothetical protein